MAEAGGGAPVAYDALYVREQLVRIDLLQADLRRRQQEVHLAAWQVAGVLLAGGAAFFAAGAAAVKLLIG